jgi:hypothetical protein
MPAPAGSRIHPHRPDQARETSWNTSGNPSPALFAMQPLSGSANGKSESNSFVIYTLFNGGSKYCDGFGHVASGNNTFFSTPGWHSEFSPGAQPDTMT